MPQQQESMSETESARYLAACCRLSSERCGSSQCHIGWAIFGAALHTVAEGPRVAAGGLLALRAAVGCIVDQLLLLLGVHVKDDCVPIHILLQQQESSQK